MNLLVGAGFAVANSFYHHLQLTKQSVVTSDTFNGIQFNSCGLDGCYSDIYSLDSVRCICSSSQQHINAAESVVREYLANDVTEAYQPQHYLNVSCALVDAAADKLVLLSDGAGVMPLWFGFRHEDPGWVASTDLIGALHLGFSELTPLGPGQALALDLTTREVVSIVHWLPDVLLPQGGRSGITDAEHFAKLLLGAAMDAVESTVPTSCSVVGASQALNASTFSIARAASTAEPQQQQQQLVDFVSEVDEMHSSSQLMECASEATGVYFRGVRKTRALVVTAPTPPAESSDAHRRQLDDIIDSVAHLMAQRHTCIREPSFKNIALERWDLCSAASSSGVLLSFDSGRQPRPLAVYLQNLLCPLLGVSVRYPLAEVAFQEALWSAEVHSSDSLLEQSVPILMGAGICHMPMRTGSRQFSLNEVGQPCQGISCVDYFMSAGRQLSGANGDNSTDDFYSPANSSWAVLRRTATLSAGRDGRIALLLVTSGYADMLRNFLGSVARLAVGGAALQTGFLVITPDPLIVALAAQFGVHSYLPPPQGTEQARDADSDHSADFGSLSYQRLILLRTECALELLLMGLQPLVVDIDAVWLRDPLLHLDNDRSGGDREFDIAVADDKGEVCGCFVVLTRSPSCVSFWRAVTEEHRALVAAATNSGLDSLAKFSDSEQKILTDLIYKKQFTLPLKVRVLPVEYFPSGFKHFNLDVGAEALTTPAGVSSNEPFPHEKAAVVHNNFLIGKEMKINRFQRRGMWFTSVSQDVSENTLKLRDLLFENAHQDKSMPSLTMVLPAHDSEVAVTPADTKNGSQLVQVSLEGWRRGEDSQKALNMTLRPKLQVWLDNDPPVVHSFDRVAIFTISIRKGATVGALTAAVEGSALTVSVDLGMNRSDFSATQFARQADETVFRSKRLESPLPAITKQEADRLNSFQATDDSDICGWDMPEIMSESKSLQYSIKVLTYKRADSLLRLLRSLESAVYCGRRNISLEIIADGPRTAQDQLQVQAVREVAQSFVWSHGSYSVRLREKNVGLATQWYDAWHPADEYGTAFVLEDDVEVSPYFFVWASRAARAYYAGDARQRTAHKLLLDAVRAHIVWKVSEHNSSDGHNSTKLSPLEEFAQLLAGQPLIYGVCLQKQHLDPLRDPQQLQIRNGNRPFLYSLVGSWGPLMFPLAWQVFREWWRWRSQLVSGSGSAAVSTESLVVNHYLRSNPGIWTPWHVRFAHETGAKCLYSNLPGEWALVTNHREAGENYATHQGPSSALLTHRELAVARLLPSHDSINRMSDDAKDVRAIKALRWSLLHLPGLPMLSRWQYDLHVRRPGELGFDRFCNAQSCLRQAPQARPELQLALAARGNALSWYEVLVSSHTQLLLPAGLTGMSGPHWSHLLNLLEAYLLPDARVLHAGASPLLPLAADLFQRHHLLLAAAEIGLEDSHCAALLLQDASLGTALHHITCSGMRALLDQEPFDAAVVNLPLLQLQLTGKYPTGHLPLLEELRRVLRAVEFIMVIDTTCASAPTQFDVRVDCTVSTDGDLKSDCEAVAHFEAVEDVCTLGSEDIGGVLYRVTTATDKPIVDRFAVSRRLQAGLITRRVT